MERRSHAIATGLFVLLLTAALGAVVAWFQGDHGEHVSYTVVATNGVPGLNLKAPVKLHGLEVGKVADIAFDPKDPRQVLVTIDVEKRAPLTVSTFARLGYQGITGLSFIDMTPAPAAERQ
jgi:phospholipid/cholesterol/gamma-HCH transport system substrate-binding protein